MARICSWCGNKIAFTDIDQGLVVKDEKEYHLCGRCNGNIEFVKNGHAVFEEIVTTSTAPELLEYYGVNKNSINLHSKQAALLKEQEQEKIEAQMKDPLYDDIHQIAGDLRFIKNYIIFTIIFGVVLGIFYLLTFIR